MNLEDLRKFVLETEKLSGDTLVVINVEHGMGCKVMSTDVEINVEDIPDFDSDEEDSTKEVVILNGYEDERYEEV